MKARWLTAALLAALIGPVAADEPKAKDAGRDITGTWSGNLDVAPTLQLRIVVKIDKADGGGLKATFASPDQGPTEFPVDPITLKDNELTFQVKRIGGSYTGKLDESGKKITGKWSQGGRTFDLSFAPADPKSLGGPEAPKELAGLWEGALDVGGAKLRLVLRVEKPKDSEKLVPVLDSPDQGAKGIPVTAIALKYGELTFECKGIGGSYKGKFDAKAGTVQGNWSQGGQSIPLDLKKTDKVTEARRPQHPQPPFPYRAEEVTYRNEPASITLAGTLTLPPGDGPFPAVVLITGSGSQDRDETIFGHKPFLVLADALTRQGIAVLRSDDRGVGGSGGGPAKATSEDYTGDALAGVAFLKSRPEIDPKAIGLVGHSEGGLIAPMAANRCDDVAFLVLLAGTGLPGDEILVRQGELILRAAKATDQTIALQTEALQGLIQVVKDEPDDKAANERMKAVLEAIVAKLPEDLKDSGALGGRTEALVQQLSTPWFRYFLTYDPRPALRQLRRPVLALNGENDLQVPAKANLDEIDRALREAGNDCFTIAELPGLNHLFQHSTTGSPTEYGAIEETFAPEALERVASWVREITGRQ